MLTFAMSSRSFVCSSFRGFSFAGGLEAVCVWMRFHSHFAKSATLARKRTVVESVTIAVSAALRKRLTKRSDGRHRALSDSHCILLRIKIVRKVLEKALGLVLLEEIYREETVRFCCRDVQQLLQLPIAASKRSILFDELFFV